MARTSGLAALYSINPNVDIAFASKTILQVLHKKNKIISPWFAAEIHREANAPDAWSCAGFYRVPRVNSPITDARLIFAGCRRRQLLATLPAGGSVEPPPPKSFVYLRQRNRQCVASRDFEWRKDVARRNSQWFLRV